MIKYRKIAAFVSSGALVLSTFVPGAFAANITVTGNGARSDNTVDYANTNTQTVVQDNNASITNNIHTNSSSGNNSASENTGGNVGIRTGDANSTTAVVNKANVNVANLGGNGGNSNGGADVTVGLNGARSNNSVDFSSLNDTSVFQHNTADFTNNVTSNATSGNNRANENTGGLFGNGDVGIRTGNANNDVYVSNAANANYANLGGSNSGGSSSFRILGNGARSDNSIDATLNNSVTAVQDNYAAFRNNIRTNTDTGYNRANENTGMGGFFINTGDANSSVDVGNMANLNVLNTGLYGGFNNFSARIGENGARSDNSVYADLNNVLSAFQGGQGAGNDADFYNNIYDHQNSGKNYASENTSGYGYGDTGVRTGNSNSDTLVRNKANVNLLGSDYRFDVGFDMHGLMAYLGL